MNVLRREIDIIKDKIRKDPYYIAMLPHDIKMRVIDVALQVNGNTIRYIYDPSEELQLLAINQCPRAIYYIDNPSVKVQLLAVSLHKKAIKDIRNPSEEVLSLCRKKSRI